MLLPIARRQKHIAGNAKKKAVVRQPFLFIFNLKSNTMKKHSANIVFILLKRLRGGKVRKIYDFNFY